MHDRRAGYRPARQVDLTTLLPTRPGVLQWPSWLRGTLCAALLPGPLCSLLSVLHGCPPLQALNDALTFTGPLLLNVLVAHLTQSPADGAATQGTAATAAAASSASILTSPAEGLKIHGGAAAAGDPSSWWHALAATWPDEGPWRGLWLAAALGASLALKALLNAHYNYRLSLVACRCVHGGGGQVARHPSACVQPPACFA